jgi:hypothetical protein
MNSQSQRNASLETQNAGMSLSDSGRSRKRLLRSYTQPIAKITRKNINSFRTSTTELVANVMK